MNGNDPAFGHGAENGHCCGLTKRELFAAMAMQWLLSNPEQFKYLGKYKLDFQYEIIGLSVEFADALIAELSKEKP